MNDGRGRRDVAAQLDAHQAQALRSAADYLSGFGRVFQLLDDGRSADGDLHEVVRTLRELHRLATTGLA